ncbi:erythromycin esterase family protein [Emticicia sp. C21]|uniref:erythromycin esterase family protein n=1 Tax=Emticicia sp. C21 TaxID=2302915 RepID=UPI000E3549A1|nr:erythromycin esterase family protein [Emticicia sp. C21]RFS17718.1 erythromycin esterase family protein [Emticicia sp. C21]
MKKQILIIITSLLVSNTYAQSFLNLDFEHETYKAQPRKWSIEGEGNFSAEVVNTDKHSGQKSLHIHLKDAETYTFLSLPKEKIEGKKIQISGYIKLSNLDSLQVMLAFKDPAGKPQVSQTKSMTLDNWNLISNEATYPTDYSSDRLLIALIVVGSGDVWFDDVSLKIDGKEFGNGKPDFAEPSQIALAIINTHCFPIKNIENDQIIDDLKPLRNVISNARIFALGENSHGSASLFKLKLKFVKYLVEKEGFTVFALESPVVEADKINDYVLKNTGTKTDVMKNLVYPSWQNADMLHIIEWLKAYNIKARRKVSFRGIDIQDGLPSLNALQQFAAQYDTLLVPKLKELALHYDTALKKNDWQSVLNEAFTLSAYLQQKSAADYTGINFSYLQSIKKYATVLVQNIHLKSGVRDRDYYMAENIKWLVEQDKDVKIIVSADNTHVTKASGKMGNYLSKALGNDYLVVGTTFNSGTYSAYGDKEFYEVHPSFVGTYEYIFSKAKYKDFIVDLRNKDIRNILPTISGFRSIGSRPQETTQFAEITLTEHFDLIAYLEKSAHTKKK